jgi:hypothetical protein
MSKKKYKISEIIEIVGASRATIYNKISVLKGSLETHISIKKGITYVDEEGIEIIKKSIGLTKEQIKKQENTSTTMDSNFLETNKKYIETLEKQIESIKDDNNFLKGQLNNKDEIIKNFQFLLKNEQENNQKLLEQNNKKNSGLFNKLFKNKKNSQI